MAGRRCRPRDRRAVGPGADLHVLEGEAGSADEQAFEGCMREDQRRTRLLLNALTSPSTSPTIRPTKAAEAPDDRSDEQHAESDAGLHGDVVVGQASGLDRRGRRRSIHVLELVGTGCGEVDSRLPTAESLGPAEDRVVALHLVLHARAPARRRIRCRVQHTDRYALSDSMAAVIRPGLSKRRRKLRRYRPDEPPMSLEPPRRPSRQPAARAAPRRGHRRRPGDPRAVRARAA